MIDEGIKSHLYMWQILHGIKYYFLYTVKHIISVKSGIYYMLNLIITLLFVSLI